MKKDKIFKRMALLQTTTYKSRNGVKRNCIKCWKGTSYEHWRVLSDIAWKLINDYDAEVYTEVEFMKGGRADLVAILPTGDGYIIEIDYSTTISSMKLKETLYPQEFTIVGVPTADFDINSWKL